MNLWQIAESTIKGEPFKVSYLGEGNSNSIMECLLSLQIPAQQQTATFANRLRTIYGDNIENLLRDLYYMVVNNVSLRYDPTGRQFIRKPSNIVKERACDCKSYALFLSSILSNLGIKNIFRFVSFEPGQEIRHVYIVVPTKWHNYILDCNLKQFDKEYPYHKNKDVMAIISSIGKINPQNFQKVKGRYPLSVAEVELRAEIATLESEKNLPQIKRNNQSASYIGKAIEYRKDMLDTVYAARMSGGAYAKQLPYLIGAIKHDWETGKYHSMTRNQLLENRKNEWDKGIRHYDSEIAGKFWKFIGKGVKTLFKTIGSAVWKTVKATGKAIGSSFKLAFDTAVLTSTLPALITSRGREKWSGKWEDVVEDMEKQRDAIKEFTLAPVNSLFEEVLDNFMEAGPYFLYYYCIPENELNQYPGVVQKKWKKQKEVFEKILKFLAVDRDRLWKIVGDSIKAQFNMPAEQVLDILKLYGSTDGIRLSDDELSEMKSSGKTPTEMMIDVAVEQQLNPLKDIDSIVDKSIKEDETYNKNIESLTKSAVSTQQQYYDSLDSIVDAAVKKQVDSKIGFSGAEEVLGVIGIIAVVLWAVSKLIAAILRLIGSLKEGETMEDYAAAFDDFGTSMGNLAKSINGMYTSDGTFDYSQFGKAVASNAKIASTSSDGKGSNTYAQFWQLCTNLSKSSEDDVEKNYYDELAQYFKKIGDYKGVASKVDGSDLIKVFDYMAEADGISDYWDIAKSRMDSISDYADGYKKLLSSGILTSTVINFLDGLSEADKAEHIQNVLSSSSGKTNSGSGILTEKAGTSWLWIIAAVGVGGYFLYKSGKKHKK